MGKAWTRWRTICTM